MSLDVLQVAIGGLVSIGVIAAGIGFLLRSFRSGADQADDRLISLQKQELEILTRRVTIMEKELAEAKEENARLGGRVLELSNQNSYLRDAVNPEALAKAIEAISKASVEAVASVARENILIYTDLLRTMEEEYLKPILDRLNRRRGDDPAYDGEERRQG